jgi:hypothetical protein
MLCGCFLEVLWVLDALFILRLLESSYDILRILSNESGGVIFQIFFF